MSVLMMQGLIAVLLLGLAYLTRSDPQTAWIYLATLVVPVAWAGAIWGAFTRGEAARQDGSWTKDFDRKERNRTYAVMGGAILLWAIAASIIVRLV